MMTTQSQNISARNLTEKNLVFQGITLLQEEDLKKNRGSGRIFTGILFAVILLFLFLALLFSVTTYQVVDSSRLSNDEHRLALSLVANSVRINDVAGAVGVGSGPEGDSLVLTEHIDGAAYETRIYSLNGSIVQEYALADAPYTPDRAREVVTSETFEFYYAHGLLTIITDQGDVSVALRSQEGSS